VAVREDAGDGMDGNVANLLIERKKGSKINTWEDLRRVLFPDDKEVPSPSMSLLLPASILPYSDHNITDLRWTMLDYEPCIETCELTPIARKAWVLTQGKLLEDVADYPQRNNGLPPSILAAQIFTKDRTGH
jgi:hypothetical protein